MNIPMDLFGELLDVNYELQTNSTLTPEARQELLERYSSLVYNIKVEVGEREWERFLANGKKMFGPKVA